MKKNCAKKKEVVKLESKPPGFVRGEEPAMQYPAMRDVLLAIESATGESNFTDGKKRSRRQLALRAAAIYLMREICGTSYPDIADAMGLGSHTSCIYHYKHVRNVEAKKMGSGVPQADLPRVYTEAMMIAYLANGELRRRKYRHINWIHTPYDFDSTVLPEPEPF